MGSLFHSEFEYSPTFGLWYILTVTSSIACPPEPDVVIGQDGLPRLSQAYIDACERFMETLVTEDDRPIDGFFASSQAMLLVEPLYSSWTHPHFGRRFIAEGNVGVFYAFDRPPVVPDVFLSLDVVLPSDLLKKSNRSYFIWKYGKSPDIVVEIIASPDGGEEREDGKLGIYSHIRVGYCVVYDPMQLNGSEPLRVYVYRNGRLVRTDERWFDHIGLGVTLWHGEYHGMEAVWLRWCDQNGMVIPTGVERAEALRSANLRHAEAEQAYANAEAEKARADRLAAKLRAAGIDPDV